MLRSIVRKALGDRSGGSAEPLVSPKFTMSADVPRPTERRFDERLLVALPTAKIVGDGWQDLCRIRNISAGGVMVELSGCRDADQSVTLELDAGQQLQGRIVWTRETTVGVKFDQSVDLREVLASRRPRIGFRPRPARLEVNCSATVRVAGLYHKVEVRDISLGGMKVELGSEDHAGRKAVVTVESLRAIKGVIRWQKDGFAGIVFDRPLAFEELAEWLGKRIEVASLQANTRIKSS